MATGQWKANQKLTKEYPASWLNVRSRFAGTRSIVHTGDRWNDRADALAKLGAGSITAAAGETDLVSDLVKKTEVWIDFLMFKRYRSEL